MKICYVEDDWEYDFEAGIINFKHKKGRKIDWDEDSWPPTKLYILTEEEYNTWYVARGHGAFTKKEKK